MSDLIHSRYQMIRELGQGGMSVVYLAIDERLKREVAVKVLHPHLATRVDSRRRFLQEATAIARLEHPHILKIYDYASPEEERSYIVSQRIKGGTLKQWMEELPPLPCELVALLALPIFEALAHAHEHNIIHRDVKPENIMIQEEDGAPILMDFGIAHLIDAETLTATGAVIGSPAHMAPEVVNGEELTASADLFSMGTVLYWMCCGALPFVAPNPAALFRRILEARFDPLLERRPETFAPLARLIERCMQRSPQERPKSAAEVAEALYRILEELGLGDHQHELRALSDDRDRYIERLPQRLAPRYLARARLAQQDGDCAAALERLDRALALDPELEEARALRVEILETPRPLIASKWSLSLVAGLALGALLWQSAQSDGRDGLEASDLSQGLALDSSALSPDSSPDSSQAEPRSLSSSERAPALLLELEGPPAPDLEEGPAQATRSASALSSSVTEPSSGLKSSAKDGAPKRTELSRRRALISLRDKRKQMKDKKRGEASGRGRLRRSKALVSPRRDGKGERGLELSAARGPRQQIVAVRSRYKGVSVWLDGERVGRIFEVERSEGLKLSLGQRHEVIFRSPYCEEQRELLRFDERLSSPPKLIFECSFKPSSFKVKGPKDAEIYLRGAVPLRLGVTNQEISYKMTQATQKISLLVVSSGRADQPLSMKLTAGKHTEAELL